MDTTSSTLLDELQRSNHQAWSRFVSLYTPLIFYWARQTGLQAADAADLVQEVFAALVVKLPEFQYDKSKSFRSWLRTVTLNKWRELWRRRMLVHSQHSSDVPENAVENELEELWEAEYQRYLLSRAMETVQVEFSQDAWAAFEQYAIHGRPVREVAEELNLSVASIYGVKSRILSRLRQILDGLADLD